MCQAVSRSQTADGAGQEPQASTVCRELFRNPPTQESLQKTKLLLSLPLNEILQRNF